MALIECPECGQHISDKAECCPNCGCPTNTNIELESGDSSLQTASDDLNNRKHHLWIWLFAAVLLCGTALGCWFLFGNKLRVEDPYTATVKLTPEFIEKIRKYDEVYPFSEGLAAVKKGDLFGYINTEGDLVIPCQFEQCAAFSDSVAVTMESDGKITLVHHDGTTQALSVKTQAHSGYLGHDFAYKDNMMWLNILNEEETGIEQICIDKSGREVTDAVYKKPESAPSQYKFFEEEGVDIYGNPMKLKGVKDATDKVIIPAKYTSVSEFSNGVASANIFIESAQTHGVYGVNYPTDGLTVSGYIDENGNTTFTDADRKKIEDYKKQQLIDYEEVKKHEEEVALAYKRQQEEQFHQKESSHNQQLQDNSLPSWMQGVWHGSVGGPNGMVISSYTVTISGSNAKFRKDGSTVYDGVCHIDGNSLRLGSVASLDIRDNALCYNLKRMTKEGGSSASSSGVNGATTFRTSTDVMDYLTRHVFYNGNQRLVIMFNTITLNARPITGAPRVVNFSNKTATIIANAPTGERFTFYLNAGNGTLSQAGTVFQAR